MSSAQHPVILVCIADEAARTSVLTHLERRYGSDYEVIDEPGERRARDRLHALRVAEREVALTIGDDGAAWSAPGEPQPLFSIARSLFSECRRSLLIDWGAWAGEGSADAVRQLIAGGVVDFYVVAPRHDPDESFHRAVTDLLQDWQRSTGSDGSSYLVIGSPLAPRTHELQSLLTRGGVAVHAIPPESDAARRTLDEAGVAYSGVPLVRTYDGTVLTDPHDAAVAASLGLATTLPREPVDLVIVGAGPAGLAAAVYAASEGLRTLVIEKGPIGGQAGSSSLIRNYLGFPRGTPGADLARRAYQQAWAFGARFAHARRVDGLRVGDDGFAVHVAGSPGEEGGDDTVRASAVVVATGVSYRRLSVPALERFAGVSVFYGATAVEARAQRGKSVCVVGGGNSAGQAALHLSRYAAAVTLIVRGDGLAASMSEYLIAELAAAGVAVVTRSRVVGAEAGETDGPLTGVELERDDGSRHTLACDALFITIGARPHTEWLPPEVLRDRWGSVFTGADVVAEGGRRAWPHDRLPAPLEASVPGIFAVGDVRRGSVKRVASAVGEGSVVLSSVHEHLARRAAVRPT
ncbi:thioredoxin reductase (NADPH) [Diaminobutyricimonas aerilata]|uniref:Thioredoxin reductase (NADPH) n=1 Tax=Diaminobutyricimonas aerilata TaxID=1162967 RepID=A0A2M9CJT4_9MICO|nr:FAD-dependent oxidoreductase [Diaminobutyricimonas aerilata]PJJ72146.1 thioredoxin reductase (NADPH) [Diaminobutyricimonas aerilata]